MRSVWADQWAHAKESAGVAWDWWAPLAATFAGLEALLLLLEHIAPPDPATRWLTERILLPGFRGVVWGGCAGLAWYALRSVAAEARETVRRREIVRAAGAASERALASEGALWALEALASERALAALASEDAARHGIGCSGASRSRGDTPATPEEPGPSRTPRRAGGGPAGA